MKDSNNEPSNQKLTLQQMYSRQNELQYAAMAHELSGQQPPAEFITEYEALRQSIKNELLNKIDDMQYGAMANALAGQTSSADFEKEFLELEKAAKLL